MKMKMARWLITLGISSLVSAATAQTTNKIFGTDFDGNGNFNSGYGFTYAGSDAGNAAAGYAGGGVIPGIGAGGSAAFSASPDYTALATDPNYSGVHAYTYSGLADHLIFNAPVTPITPTANLASLVLSFDTKVFGLLTNLSNTDVTLQLLQFKSAGNVVFEFNGDGYVAGSNFVHFDVPLSALTLDFGSPGNLTNSAVMASIDSFEVEFRVTGETGTMGGNPPRSPVFGFSNTGRLIIDNVYLNQTSAVNPTPTQEKTIMDVNFDNKPGAAYGFTFSDNGTAPYVVTTNLTGGVNGSAAAQITADFSSWATNPPVANSGFGVGASVTPIPFGLMSSNKASYRVYLTAKAGGFLDGITQVSGVVGIQFCVPDGTLTASNGSPDIVLELAPTLFLTTNYQSFVFDGQTSPVGIYNGGSLAQFSQYLSQVSTVQVQVQIAADAGNPPVIFGYDRGNTITIDNIKVVELVPATPPLSVTVTNKQVQVFWADPGTGGTAKLQSSTNAAGPYLDVAGSTSGAASPYTVPAGGHAQFFRTIWVP
jgi:hypothetical protein